MVEDVFLPELVLPVTVCLGSQGKDVKVRRKLFSTVLSLTIFLLSNNFWNFNLVDVSLT